jgi:hypothetical protein
MIGSVSLRAGTSVVWACACCGAAPDICPPDTPDFRVTRVTVTEGSATTFPLYASGPLPNGSVSGQINTGDQTIATLSGAAFAWSLSNYPPTFTAFGVDDQVADGSARMTGLYGVVLDCGGGPSFGEVFVVDRESLQVSASPWEIETSVGVSSVLTIQLTQAPPADVSVVLVSAESSVANVAPTSFMLGSDNWNSGVTTTVMAVGSGHTAIAVVPGSDSGLATYNVAVDVDSD